MTPLETTWRGYRFRSRTEARWGVVLALSGVRFEYEAEGFNLASGWYLPDFWLPDRRLWIEVKGQELNEREQRLAIELEAQSGRRVLFAIGQPDGDDPDPFTTVAPDGSMYVSRLEELTPEAFRAARAERFDGKPAAPSRIKPRRWW